MIKKALVLFTLIAMFSGSVVFAEQIYNPDFKFGSVEIKDNGKYVRFKVNFNHQNTADMKNILKYVNLPFKAILSSLTLYPPNITPDLVVRNTVIKGSYIYFAFDHLKTPFIKPCNKYSLKTYFGYATFSAPYTDKIVETIIDNNESFSYFQTNMSNVAGQISGPNDELPAGCPSNGKLYGAVSSSTPNSSIVIAGDTNVPMTEYKFTAVNEAFTVKKLDVVIDTDFNFSDNQSDDGASNNIKKVSLFYTKKDGTPETVSASLLNGKASFTDLNFYISKDNKATIKILADINTIGGGAVSGASFKLGFNEQTGLANNSFEAIGEESNEKKTAADLTSYFGSNLAVKQMVVRKTKPFIAKLFNATNKLINGSNDISAVKISAKKIALKKMSFEFVSNGNLDVSGLQLYRKQSTGETGEIEFNITNDISITNAAGQDLKTGTKLAAKDTIYVTWNDQDFVTADTMDIYILRANVTNATAGNSISTYMPAESDQSIFTANASGMLNSGYKFIWSDLSANPHSLDSMDWTSGYLMVDFPTESWSLVY